MEQKTALIIGAGPAGLTAAYELLHKTDYHPVVLELDGQVGGISKTVTHNHNRMDLGGHRFFTKSPEVQALWESLMPAQGAPAVDELLLHEIPSGLAPNGADPQAEEAVLLNRRRVSRILFLRKFFDYPISLKPSTITGLGLGRTARAGFGYLGAMLHKRPENTLEDFMVNRFGTVLYGLFFRDYTKKVWGRDPSEISAEWGRQRIRGLSLWKAVRAMLLKPFGGSRQTETSLIEQFQYPKRGPGQLYELLAGRVTEGGGQLLLNTRVTALELDEGRVRSVRAVGPDGTERVFSPELVLSSMPVKDLVAAMGGAVPDEVRRVAAGLPYRDFITVGLLVDRLLLKNETKLRTVGDIVPDCWIYVQEPEVKVGRLQIFNNWSPYMVENFSEQVFLGMEYFCEEGDEMWCQSDEDFIRFAVDELVQIGVIASCAAVLDSVRIRVSKAYPAYFDTYAEFAQVRTWLDGVGNLYCIGRNGQHRYNNMDHSILTAMRAVDCIRGAAPRSAVWEVNTEEDYHEEQKPQHQ